MEVEIIFKISILFLLILFPWTMTTTKKIKSKRKIEWNLEKMKYFLKSWEKLVKYNSAATKFFSKAFQDKYINTSSWSIKGHQFGPVQYSLQCHGELSSCLLYDLRKYRAHHSLLVRFQRNLVWRRHLSAIYNDGSIPSPIFLPPIIPNGAKITGCFSQCWEGGEGGTYRLVSATQVLVAEKTFLSPAPFCVMDCIWSQQGV